MVDAPVMAGKSVLVTGGTGGIGRATAIGLAALGARVGITGRDPARTEAAAASIRAAPGRPAVDAFAADMSVQAGVRRLAAQVLDTYPRLDVLVNNVGGFWAHRHVTADGLERTFALNHLAPFLLTSLLLDRLTASAPARIVTVSSGAHARGRIDFDDLQGERNYSGQRAYSQSKLASVMFTYELARRLEGTGVTATVLHPGVVRNGSCRRPSTSPHSPFRTYRRTAVPAGVCDTFVGVLGRGWLRSYSECYHYSDWRLRCRRKRMSCRNWNGGGKTCTGS